MNWEELYNRLRDHGPEGTVIEALSGVGTALGDIKGKAAGLPVYMLMGGASCTGVQPYATGFYRRAGRAGQEDALVTEAEMHGPAARPSLNLLACYG